MDDELAGFPLLTGLTAAQRTTLAAIAREVSFRAGQRIFDEGQPARACWLIRAGRVAIDTAIPGRAGSTLQTLGAGELLGWSWLVAPYRWHFGAVAVGPVTAVELDAVRLRAIADADPALGYPLALGLLTALLHRLQDTRARLLDLYGSPRAT